jgi:hypothetical protein
MAAPINRITGDSESFCQSADIGLRHETAIFFLLFSKTCQYPYGPLVV